MATPEEQAVASVKAFLEDTLRAWNDADRRWHRADEDFHRAFDALRSRLYALSLAGDLALRDEAFRIAAAVEAGGSVSPFSVEDVDDRMRSEA
jgi:hypothetical protein